MANDIYTANRLQPSGGLGSSAITHCILVPFGTRAVNLVNNSANYGNFHMSSFYICGAAKFLKEEKA